MIRKATSSDVASILLVTKACAKSMISKGIYQWNEHYPNAAAFEKDIKRNELYEYAKTLPLTPSKKRCINLKSASKSSVG